MINTGSIALLVLFNDTVYLVVVQLEIEVFHAFSHLG